MAPLTVDPAALDGAGTAVISAGQGLGRVISTLTTALGGCSGMAGDDPAGAAFGQSYNNSASKLLDAMATTRNGLCRLGDGVRMSAHNYSLAEANSNISAHGEPLPVPPPTGPVSAGSTPSAVGSGVGAPADDPYVVLGVAHNNYGHMAVLNDETRTALAKDFGIKAPRLAVAGLNPHYLCRKFSKETGMTPMAYFSLVDEVTTLLPADRKQLCSTSAHLVSPDPPRTIGRPGLTVSPLHLISPSSPTISAGSGQGPIAVLLRSLVTVLESRPHSLRDRARA